MFLKSRTLIINNICYIFLYIGKIAVQLRLHDSVAVLHKQAIKIIISDYIDVCKIKERLFYVLNCVKVARIELFHLFDNMFLHGIPFVARFIIN